MIPRFLVQAIGWLFTEKQKLEEEQFWEKESRVQFEPCSVCRLLPSEDVCSWRVRRDGQTWRYRFWSPLIQYAGFFSHHQASLGHPMSVPQFNSILTLSP